MEKSKRIFNFLIADDDTNLQFVLNRAINGVGEQHKLTSVYNGVQLLDYLSRRGPYKNFRDPLPDCIFLDLNLPVLSGRNVLKLINEHALYGNLRKYVQSGKFHGDEKVILIDSGYTIDKPNGPDNNSLDFILDEILEQISFLTTIKTNGNKFLRAY